MSCLILVSQFSLFGKIWSWSFLLRNRLIFALHHIPHRLFFLLVKKTSLVLSLCYTLALHVWSGSWGTASWNWILHSATGKGGKKIHEWGMSVAKYRILNLELWSHNAPACRSEAPWLSHQTTPQTFMDTECPSSESTNELKISVSRDPFWVECFGHKQHRYPFLKSMCFNMPVIFCTFCNFLPGVRYG